MEIYLAALCILSLVLSAAGLIQSYRIRGHAIGLHVAMAQASRDQAATLVAQNSGIRQLTEIIMRQEQKLADQETRIMGLIQKRKD